MPIFNLGSIEEVNAATIADVPADVVAKWKAIWDASVSTYSVNLPGAVKTGYVEPFMGKWEFVLESLTRTYRANQSQTIANTDAMNSSIVMDATSHAAGQFNLDLFGQILAKYGNSMSQGDRDILNDFFINWRQTKTPAQVDQVTKIMQRYGVSIAPGKAAQEAIEQVKTLLPQSAPDISLAFSNPTAFYQQVLDSLHTIKTSVVNKEAGDYLPPQGGSVKVSNGLSQALDAADWAGASRNQAFETQQADDAKVSQLNTGYRSPLPSSPYVREAISTAPANTTGGSSIPPWMLIVGAIGLFKFFRR